MSASFPSPALEPTETVLTMAVVPAVHVSVTVTAKETTPPALWRQGEAVIDSFRVRVWNDVTPGDYEVRISLNIRPLGGDLDLRDFLSDRDRYDGVRIGSVTIE